MNIPSIPRANIVDQTGNMEMGWRKFFEQLINEMQANVSNEGYVVPQLNTDQLNQLSTPDNSGRIVFDSDANVMKINNNGTFKEIAVVP